MNKYREPEGPVTYEEKIKRSVFIANLSPCHTEHEARDFLAQISSLHHNASHNCRAYIIGDTEYSSDDGEPSGTAGRPILNAIKRSGLVNVIVVVTRYFGGVKLGVRGLIDAYGGVAAKAVDMAGAIERVRTEGITLTLAYSSVGMITRLLEGYGALNMRWSYGAEVSVSTEVPCEVTDGLVRELDGLQARGIIIKWEKR